jgi:hypothetical protein
MRYNYYSYVNPITRKMTDRKWETLLQKGRTPKKPPFTKAYWAPGNPTKQVEEKPDARHHRISGP